MSQESILNFYIEIHIIGWATMNYPWKTNTSYLPAKVYGMNTFGYQFLQSSTPINLQFLQLSERGVPPSSKQIYIYDFSHQ